MKYFKKKATIFLFVFLLLSVVVLIAIIIQDELRMKKQNYFYVFNKVSENASLKNNNDISLINLSSDKEKEIHNIIRKSFEGQWNYYYDENENKLDQSIKDLYYSKGYDYFRKEMEDEFTKQRGRYEGIISGDIPRFIKKIEFSKFRGYRDLNNRVGLIAGFMDTKNDMHYFLFKKVNDHWKIERERMPMFFSVLSCEDDSIIKQLLEQQNNETPEAEIAAYMEAVKQDDKIKALEVWQLLKKENINSNLEKRHDNITEELIERKIKDFEIINIEWRSGGVYIEKDEGILEDYRSDLASGARAQVQITDSNNNKSNYIFDIFVEGIYPDKTERDYFSLRNWILRDVYPENEKPLFWVIES